MITAKAIDLIDEVMHWVAKLHIMMEYFLYDLLNLGLETGYTGIAIVHLDDALNVSLDIQQNLNMDTVLLFIGTTAGNNH